MTFTRSALLAAAAVTLLGSGAASADEAMDAAAHVPITNHVCGSVTPAWKVPALEDPKSASAVEVGCAVAAWQLAAKEDMSYLPFKVAESAYGRGWVKAAFYIGLENYASKLGDDGLIRRVRQYAFENGFELGDRPWHGDDHAVAAVYGALALRDENPALMNKSIAVFDDILAQNYNGSLEFVPTTSEIRESDCQERWCWADAIFMAPPSWALASKTSGDPRYVDYAARETRAIIEYLLDPKSGLMFRDSRFFDAETSNGKGVFWSRGNGWVFAGLARFIEVMPEDHPERPLMVATFKSMADAIVGLQRDDGYWPTSLLDPDLVTNPETSGTAFFGYGLAWGINNGFLSGEKYASSRNLAWDAMRASTTASGKVGYVQQIGNDPQATNRESSQLYTAGGMLLFAAEMLEVEAE